MQKGSRVMLGVVAVVKQNPVRPLAEKISRVIPFARIIRVHMLHIIEKMNRKYGELPRNHQIKKSFFPIVNQKSKH